MAVTRRCLVALFLALPGVASAQAPPGVFVEVIPTEGRAAVRIAVNQVVRVGRARIARNRQVRVTGLFFRWGAIREE